MSVRCGIVSSEALPVSVCSARQVPMAAYYPHLSMLTTVT